MNFIAISQHIQSQLVDFGSVWRQGGQWPPLGPAASDRNEANNCATERAGGELNAFGKKGYFNFVNLKIPVFFQANAQKYFYN